MALAESESENEEKKEAAAAGEEQQRQEEGRRATDVSGKKIKLTGKLCNGWQRWVISTQLHE
jgi:hypothetical protein